MPRRIFVPKKQEEQESGENGIVKGFRLFILLRTSLGRNRYVE
jgi:hypothetical protein